MIYSRIQVKMGIISVVPEGYNCLYKIEALKLNFSTTKGVTENILNLSRWAYYKGNVLTTSASIQRKRQLRFLLVKCTTVNKKETLSAYYTIVKQDVIKLF